VGAWPPHVINQGEHQWQSPARFIGTGCPFLEEGNWGERATYVYIFLSPRYNIGYIGCKTPNEENVVGWKAVCTHLDTYGTANWNSALTSWSRHVSFTLTQPPRTPQGSRNTWLPNGVSYLGLCTELHGHHSVLYLQRSCLSVLLRVSRLRYESPVQEFQMHHNSEVLQWESVVHLPCRKGFWAALWDVSWGFPSNAPNC
jgi:hypothetical protein